MLYPLALDLIKALKIVPKVLSVILLGDLLYANLACGRRRSQALALDLIKAFKSVPNPGLAIGLRMTSCTIVQLGSHFLSQSDPKMTKEFCISV